MGIAVAVTAASRPLGRVLRARLDADPSVDRVVALDGDGSTAGVPDPLAGSLDDVDVVVHVCLPDGLRAGDPATFGTALESTRRVLAAMAASGVRRLVHIGSATAYGAHPDNDVPLTEDSPLRANPDFGFGYHHLLAEELVTAWSSRHPDAAVAILRPVTMLGPDVDDLVTRHLESPRLPLVKGMRPPVQVVHVEDVAAAAQLAATRGLRGPFDVAAEGWLSVPEVVSLLGRKPLWLPEQVAESTGQQLWRRGLLPVAPGALRYLMHPWVVSSDRLRAQGWAPAWSNRDVLRQFADSHDAYLSLGWVRMRRRRIAAGIVAGTGVGAVTGYAVIARWRARRS